MKYDFFWDKGFPKGEVGGLLFGNNSQIIPYFFKNKIGGGPQEKNDWRNSRGTL